MKKFQNFPLQQQQQQLDGTTTKDDESAETERPIVTLFNERPFIFQIWHHHRSEPFDLWPPIQVPPVGLDFILTGAFIDRSGAEEKKIPERNGTFLCVVKKKERRKGRGAGGWMAGPRRRRPIRMDNQSAQRRRKGTTGCCCCCCSVRIQAKSLPTDRSLHLGQQTSWEKKESNKLRFF